MKYLVALTAQGITCYTHPMTPLQQAAERLVSLHGGLRAAARALKISPGYLVKIRYGDRTNVSDDILKSFGVSKSITFREIAIPGQRRRRGAHD